MYIFQGNDNWKEIDGNNKNRDLVAGPGWLLTRYPSGKTWKWHKDTEKWEALSGDEKSNVTQLVSSQVSNHHVYRLFKDGSIQKYLARRSLWHECYSSNEKNTYISVDKENLYRVTEKHEGYVDKH